jgi:hypothetical protein
MGHKNFMNFIKILKLLQIFQVLVNKICINCKIYSKILNFLMDDENILLLKKIPKIQNGLKSKNYKLYFLN